MDLSEMLYFAADEGDKEMVEQCSIGGGYVNFRFGDILDSPLHRAAENGRDDVVTYLCSNGADVNIMDIYKQTPMHRAVINNQLECLIILLEHDARMNLRDLQRGYTPVHYACKFGNIECLRVLIEAKARIDMKSLWTNTTPLMLANYGSYDEITQLLISNGAAR